MAIDIDPPDWGDTGTKPPDGLEFDGGDTYNAQYADWLWYNFGQLIEQTNQSLNENLNATSYKGNDIDSDGDGCVNCAEFSQSGNATSYKGNDIDVDGDGVVNTAHDVEKWYRSTDIPKTEIQPGNYAIGRELYVPDGWEIYFYESALEPDETPIPNGLEIIAADVTRDVTFFRDTDRFNHFYDWPNTQQPGPCKVRIYIRNGTGSTQVASGGAVWSLEEM